jgi:hypothetical protein
MKLAANTSLEITEYLYNPAEKTRQGLVSLTVGKARFAVQDLQDFRDKRFRVQTRTALVGSRDTDFIVEFKPGVSGNEGLLSALCLENSIFVVSVEFPDRPALLTANMISQVYGVNLPTPPRFATSAELSALLSGLEQIGNRNNLPPSSQAASKKGGQSGPSGTTGTGSSTGTPGDLPDIQSQFPSTNPGLNQGIFSVTSTTTTTTTTTLPPGASPCGGGLMGAGSPCPGASPAGVFRGGHGVNQK